MRLRFSARRPWRALAVVAAVAALPVLAPTTASAGAPKAEHCVVTVTGQAPDGTLTTTPMQCFSTYPEVLRAVGVTPTSDSASPAELGRDALLRGSFIAIHYDLANFNSTNGSLTVNGTGCTGGTLSLPVAWRNRISSTQHFNGCTQIRHYEGLPPVTGSWEDTAGGGGNLTSLNNMTDYVWYKA